MKKEVIILVGLQGAGKTNYCQKNLPDYERISQDDQGKDHMPKFHAAIQRGVPKIVVDRTNHDRRQRERFLAPAKKAGYKTKIIWLNVEKDVCVQRCKERGKHPTLKEKDIDKAVNMCFTNFQYPSKNEADELEIIGPPPVSTKIHDIREEIGDRRYIVVGDVHGCFDELMQLLDEAGFNPEEDVLVSVGDLIDRGPKTKEVMDFVMGLPRFYMTLGNHEEKFLRYAKGNKVKIAHGLQGTIDALGEDIQEVAAFVKKSPLILQVPDGFVVHAGFDPRVDPEEQMRSDCLYMRYYGGNDYFDDINGVLWHTVWPSDRPRVFFGHNPDPAGPNYHNIMHLDGGCVFGGFLKAWDSKGGVVHFVQAKEEYSSHGNKEMDENATPVTQREDYVNSGLIRSDRTDDGKLAIYTYTDQAVFDRHWDDITMNSRGHIYDVDSGERVACAFPKFFNMNERPETQQEALDWSQPYSVFEKMDGWLGVLYRHEGVFKVASRGSFHSPGAEWATKFIQTKDLSCLPDDATLVFEIITPEQKIILDYEGEKNLYILAAFNRHTGDEYPRKQVEEWSEKTGLPIVKQYDSLTVEDMVKVAKEVEGTEGFVVRFEDGLRVKIKTEWYCQIAKIMANLSPISLWESMKKGRVPTERIAEIPEELRELAEGYRDKLEDQYKKVSDKVLPEARSVVKGRNGQVGEDRKAIALSIKDKPSVVRRVTFLVLDKNEKAIEKVLMDVIYPKANEWVDLEEVL